MWIYVLQIFCILTGVFVSMFPKRNRKLYCAFITIIFILLCGLRSKHLGPPNSWGVTDTENVHIPAFLAALHSNWMEIFQGWLSGDSNFRDIGSCVFYKFISYVSSQEQFFIFASCIPLFIVLSRYIYKYSAEPVMSYFLLLGLNYFTGSMYLTRHMLAVTVVIIAYDYLYQKKSLKYITTIFIAALFHKTALIALILYPIANIRWSKKQWIIILTGLLFGLFGNNIWEFVLKKIIIIYPMWSNFSERNFNNSFGQTWFIAMGILFFILLKKKALYKNHPYFTSVNLNMLTLGCVFYGMMNLLSEFSRVALFFMPSAIILLPNAVAEIKKCSNKINKIIISIGIYLVFGIYYLLGLTSSAGARPYMFFFE